MYAYKLTALPSGVGQVGLIQAVRTLFLILFAWILVVLRVSGGAVLYLMSLRLSVVFACDFMMMKRHDVGMASWKQRAHAELRHNLYSVSLSFILCGAHL